jgi:hypothetical protein
MSADDDLVKAQKCLRSLAKLNGRVRVEYLAGWIVGVRIPVTGGFQDFTGATLEEALLAAGKEILAPLAEAERARRRALAADASAPLLAGTANPGHCTTCGQVTTYDGAAPLRATRRLCLECFKRVLASGDASASG